MSPRKIILFGTGPLGVALLSLITLPLITWFFSQEDVGRMAMLQVAVSFSTLLFTLGLDQAYVREYHEVDDQPGLLKNVMLPGLLLLVGTLAVLLSLGDTLAVWLFDVPAWHLSVLVAVALLAAFISRFFSLILRMREQGLAYSMSQVLPKLLLLCIIVGYIYFGADKTLTNLVVANTAAVTFVFFVFAWNTRKEWLQGLRKKLNPEQLKNLLRFGFPLILGGLAFWGMTAIDKVFLRALSSFEELGIYSVAVSFAAAATIVQSVFSTVWVPTVYKWVARNEGLENIQRVTRYVLLAVIVLFSLTGLLSWVLTYALPEKYESVQWIVIACVGYPLLYTLSETTVVGIGVSRRSAFSMLAAVITFLINFAGNWLLIPKFGAAGAAVSTCGSFLIFFVLRTEFSSYLWRSIPRRLLYAYTFTLVSGAILSTLLADQLGWVVYGFWSGMLISVFFVFPSDLKDAWDFFVRTFHRGLA